MIAATVVWLSLILGGLEWVLLSGYSASDFPQVNPLSFAQESLTQPERESGMGLAFETVFPKGFPRLCMQLDFLGGPRIVKNKNVAGGAWQIGTISNYVPRSVQV